MITVRRATRLDLDDMASLLNEIIAAGGTTALTRAVTADDLGARIDSSGDRGAWHVALDGQDRVVGFQWIAPNTDLPPEAADIATFVQTGQTGLGIGSALFDATKEAAMALGYGWINATIRADNEGGQIYYQSRGFEDYGMIRDVPLSSGLRVDKRLKRYDLGI